MTVSFPRKRFSHAIPLRWTMFAVCLIAFTVRGWPRLMRPGIWAEDGTVHLLGALNGISVFSPADGYIQFVQRLILVVSIQFPFPWIASIVCVTCFILWALMLSAVAGEKFAWLIPSKVLRAILCLLLCFAPGFFEILGNAANLYHGLFLSLVLIGLGDAKKSISYIEAALVFVLAASTGPSFLTAPLFAWRLWHSYRQGLPIRRLVPTFLCLLFVFGFSLANFLFRHSIPLKTEFSLTEAFLCVRSVLGQMVFAPVFGGYLTSAAVNYEDAIVWSFSYVAALAITIYLIKQYGWRSLQLFACIAAIFTFPILTVIVRPHSLNIYTERPMATMWFWGFRYSFLAYAGGLIVWFAALSQLIKDGGRKTKAAVSVLIAGIAFCTVNQMDFTLDRYGRSHWHSQARALQRSYKTGYPAEVDIPIYPEPWVLKYKHEAKIEN